MCVYVCMYACMYVCTYVRMYVCMHVKKVLADSTGGQMAVFAAPCLTLGDITLASAALVVLWTRVTIPFVTGMLELAKLA